jgi:hypothetical protein
VDPQQFCKLRAFAVWLAWVRQKTSKARASRARRQDTIEVTIIVMPDRHRAGAHTDKQQERIQTDSRSAYRQTAGAHTDRQQERIQIDSKLYCISP